MNAIIERHPWLPYVAPFALFAGLTGLQPYVPGGIAWVYPAKTVLTGLLILGMRRWLVPGDDWFALTATITGLLVLVLWILPEGLYPLLGNTTIFDPYQHFFRAQAIVWIGFRLTGAALVVPIAEEFFWRGFLIRWLVGSDFQTVAAGTFTWISFLITSGLFAAEHAQWLVGLMAGIAYKTCSGTARGASRRASWPTVSPISAWAVWVLATGQWSFW